MTIDLDNFDLLDSTRELRKVDAALGHGIFDKWSDLDPALAAQRINALHPGTLGTAETLDDYRKLLALRVLSGGGGGWPPVNAKITIDLVNNRAWTEANGIVAINTLLGSDPNTVNGWSATSYSAGDLTADGLVYLTNPPAMIGLALTKVLAGATIRYQYKCLDINSSVNLALLTADGSDGMEVDLSASVPGRLTIRTWSGTTADHDNVVNSGAGDINAVTITIAPSRFETAADGSVAYINSDVHPNVVAAIVETNGIHTALQSITIYDALPDTSGLSALSVVS